MSPSWSSFACSLLLFLRDVEKYPMSFVADVVTRETGRWMSENAAIGLYNRCKQKGIQIIEDEIKDYRRNAPKTPAQPPEVWQNA